MENVLGDVKNCFLSHTQLNFMVYVFSQLRGVTRELENATIIGFQREAARTGTFLKTSADAVAGTCRASSAGPP
jgi:hypothetical protein